PIVELETDKVTVEVPAPAAGTLAEISVQEGETVEVGALLGSISAGGAPAKKEEKPKAEEKPAKEDKKAEPAPAKAEAASKTGDMPPAPSAAKMMAEKGVSADQVEGSGKRGQILKEDVMAAIAKGTNRKSTRLNS